MDAYLPHMLHRSQMTSHAWNCSSGGPWIAEVVLNGYFEGKQLAVQASLGLKTVWPLSSCQSLCMALAPFAGKCTGI